MTLLEKLQAHRGSLIRLRTPLYWYGGRDTNSLPAWDKIPGRICLLLDASASFIQAEDLVGEVIHTIVNFRIAAAAVSGREAASVGAAVATHLLIDGQPRWIWVTGKDVDLLSDVS